MLAKLTAVYFSIARWTLKAISTVWGLIKKITFTLLVAAVPLLVVWWITGKITDWMEFSDDVIYRGAAAILEDPFDKPISQDSFEYLDQGWSGPDSLWFYNATQGSNLLPYDFFLALEIPESNTKFRDPLNINRYRYLPQVGSDNNPDALPVGMSKDTYQGKEYMGFTCAACHTSQINYNGHAIRIDGGPAAADMENFILDLASALEATIHAKQNRPAKIERFYAEILSHGQYDTTDQIDEDLNKFARQIRSYAEINKPAWKDEDNTGITHYGFGRLDAFGRIYNRVLQYVISPKQLWGILQRVYPEEILKVADSDLKSLFDFELEKNQRNNLYAKTVHVLDTHLQTLSTEARQKLANQLKSELFNSANAPVSIPYLWDIPHHDYVQWTGLVSNAGLGPLGRNVGQVIGVFGTLDWQERRGWTFNSLLAGQGFGDTYIDYKSSISKRNLSRVEKHLRELKSPQWPEHILPKIDYEKAKQGQKLFANYCESCHTNIDRESEDRKIVVHLSHADLVGTDSVLASNTVAYSGYSGLLQGKYVGAGPGNLVMEAKSPVASLVKYSTKNVVTEWDPDKNPIRRVAEWVYDLIKTIGDNEIKPSLKRGTYDAATTVNPFRPLFAYKARALNGIWATAPYLHNGSVPNLAELLLPWKAPGDPEIDDDGNKISYRSPSFTVGSREFDPEKVGFRTSGYDGFVFDTAVRGNSNAGHEYASGRTKQLDGRTLPALNAIQRSELLEYLKTL